MTRTNPKLKELPDHKHYAACLNRKLEIDDYCQKLFVQVCIYCVMMLLLTFFTVRFTVISWIPSLFGSSTELLPFFTQILIVVGIGVLAGVNCSSHKICGVILFFIFLAMAFFGMIQMNLPNSASFIIGVAGVVASFRSIGVYFDYEQLKNTEGYPYFSQTIAYQEENSVYNKPYRNSPQPVVDDVFEEPEDTSFAALDPLDVITEMPAIPASIKSALPVDKAAIKFVPNSGKFCYMAESKIKTHF